MASHRDRKKGFLSAYNLADKYLLKPDANNGRPGLSEGNVNGVNVLVKIWPRNSKSNDEDISEIWRHELRQLHRLSGYPGVGDSITSLLATGHDENGFYLVLDPGQRAPLATLLRTATAAAWINNPKSDENRLLLWRNIARIVDALEILHSQGLLHRNIDAWAILASGFTEADFQLTGFEWSMRLAGISHTNSGKGKSRLEAARYDSFASDWRQLAELTTSLLHADLGKIRNSTIPPFEVADHLASSEVRLLRKMIGVERTDRLDGDCIKKDIEEICRQIEAHIANQDPTYRLVVRLGPESKLSQAIRDVSAQEIETNNIEEQINFINDDISQNAKLVAVRANGDFRFSIQGHQLIYNISAHRPGATQEPTWDFAFCASVEEGLPNKRNTLGAPLEMVPGAIKVITTSEAKDTFSRMRRRVSSWELLRKKFLESKEDSAPERKILKGLTLTLLVEMAFAMSDIFPVKVIRRSEEAEEDGTYKISINIRNDDDRNQLARALKLKSTGERFDQLLSTEGAGEEGGWRLTTSTAFGEKLPEDTDWRFVKKTEENGSQFFVFSGAQLPVDVNDLFLIPNRSAGTIAQFKRRLKALSSLSEHSELLRMLHDPRSRLFESHEGLNKNDAYFLGLDEAKQNALEQILDVIPIYLLQGPPGVGKTHLVKELVRRNFSEDQTARILLTAQSHSAVDHLMGEVKALFSENSASLNQPLIVRCRKKEGAVEADPSDVHAQAEDIILKLKDSRLLKKSSADLKSKFDEYFGDDSKGVSMPSIRKSSRKKTSANLALEGIILRAANMVFATTNARELESLIDERGQFDWTIVEEAGKATGGELVSPLLLSHRRLMIGDHKQLPPYRSDEMRKILESPADLEEVVRITPSLISRSLKGGGVDDLIDDWDDTDAIEIAGNAVSTLLMFESIFEPELERQERKKLTPKIAGKLTFQHRMHPQIALLVSDVFYDGKLKTHPDREKRFLSEPSPVESVVGALLPINPIVVIETPDVQKTRNFRQSDSEPYWWNEFEVKAVIESLASIAASKSHSKKPTLAVLSPYAEQVKQLRKAIKEERHGRLKNLSAFSSGNGDEYFCSTVDAFQGSEADIVVISLVRNNGSTKPNLALGFLSDSRRMNVLLSRAKHKLILVGSFDFLRSVIGKIPGDNGKLLFLKRMIAHIDAGIESKAIGRVFYNDSLKGFQK